WIPSTWCGAVGEGGRPRVTGVRQLDERVLELQWTTGRTTTHDVVELRRRCPCALCVDELTGRGRLAPGDVPDAVRPVELRSVGRYALAITFDDGHATGIYPFELLHDRWRISP